MYISILASIASLVLGAWLIDASRFPQSAMDAQAIQKENNITNSEKSTSSENLRHISLAMMVIGCFAILFGTILLLNGTDYFFIVRGKKEHCMAKPYFERAS